VARLFERFATVRLSIGRRTGRVIILAADPRGDFGLTLFRPYKIPTLSASTSNPSSMPMSAAATRQASA
jgi:hypothetical protein